MEAKIDINKLQLLNDRINQCMDALTQVRFSVHGLSHSGVANPLTNQMAQPMANQVTGWAPTQVAPQQFVGPATLGNPAITGLQHSPYVPYYDPRQISQMQVPAAVGMVGGLSHSNMMSEQMAPEGRGMDPYRISRTFPFAFNAPTQVALW